MMVKEVVGEAGDLEGEGLAQGGAGFQTGMMMTTMMGTEIEMEEEEEEEETGVRSMIHSILYYTVHVYDSV